MSDKYKSGPETEFSTESSWPLGSNSDSVYFFGSDRISSILRDWNLHPEESYRSRENGELGDLVDDRSGLAGSLVLPDSRPTVPIGSVPKGDGGASTSNPSVSSSSSEDMPEKSAASGENPPPEIASKMVRKKGQQRIRQPRFAFMTKSEVDNLEDGYQWRKYGQKAVKNSPFARSYYRCTNIKCTVKKRVERSNEDPTIVITTYEGQHCHHSTVGYSRGGVISHEAVFGSQLASPPASLYYDPAAQISAESCHSIPRSIQVPGEAILEIHAGLPQPTPQLPTDEGLLDDIVSPRMHNR